MNAIFYAKKTTFPTSKEFLSFILREKLNIVNFEIEKNENGKPFLILPSNSSYFPLFFSVTHTKENYFIAISNENVGIDAELLNRAPNYLPILSKFSQAERDEIQNTQDFLKFWTIKESAIKWLGGSIAYDLQKLSYEKGLLKYKELELPLKITQIEVDSHVLTVCSATEQNWHYERIDV